MTEPPERYKQREDYTMDEEVAAVQAEQRGDPPPRFERDEYRQARREALEDAGLEPEDDAEKPTPLEDMTPEDHFNRIRRKQ
jgi:rRNA maturation protein Nop10